MKKAKRKALSASNTCSKCLSLDDESAEPICPEPGRVCASPGRGDAQAPQKFQDGKHKAYCGLSESSIAETLTSIHTSSDRTKGEIDVDTPEAAVDTNGFKSWKAQSTCQYLNIDKRASL
mgnify:CR=1 FL=1